MILEAPKNMVGEGALLAHPAAVTARTTAAIHLMASSLGESVPDGEINRDPRLESRGSLGRRAQRR
jgi:hypothetical protein